MTEKQLPLVDLGTRVFKGESVPRWREGATSGRRAQAALTVILKLVLGWSDLCHPDCLSTANLYFQG